MSMFYYITEKNTHQSLLGHLIHVLSSISYHFRVIFGQFVDCGSANFQSCKSITFFSSTHSVKHKHGPEVVPRAAFILETFEISNYVANSAN